MTEIADIGGSSREEKAKSKADPSLTTPKLNYIWGPVHSG
jgi:hypothetical protein